MPRRLLSLLGLLLTGGGDGGGRSSRLDRVVQVALTRTIIIVIMISIMITGIIARRHDSRPAGGCIRHWRVPGTARITVDTGIGVIMAAALLCGVLVFGRLRIRDLVLLLPLGTAVLEPDFHLESKKVDKYY